NRATALRKPLAITEHDLNESPAGVPGSLPSGSTARVCQSVVATSYVLHFSLRSSWLTNYYEAYLKAVLLSRRLLSLTKSCRSRSECTPITGSPAKPDCSSRGWDNFQPLATGDIDNTDQAHLADPVHPHHADAASICHS